MILVAGCGGGGDKTVQQRGLPNQPVAAGPGAAAQPGAPTPTPGAPAGVQGPTTALTTYTKFEDVCRVTKMDRHKKDPVAVDLDGQPIAAGQPLVMIPDQNCCPQVKTETSKGPDGKDHVTAVNCVREELGDDDFKADVNRDPFHSYVVDVQPEQEHPTGVAEKTKDPCDGAKVIAPDYGWRDLKLVGIVSKGTQAYTLWVDMQQTGYRAKRNDCLSKDHAQIKEIGDNLIILQIFPPPGSTITDVREEPVQLHPEDEVLNNQLHFGKDDQ
jgi:hypothetical protein